MVVVKFTALQMLHTLFSKDCSSWNNFALIACNHLRKIIFCWLTCINKPVKCQQILNIFVPCIWNLCYSVRTLFSSRNAPSCDNSSCQFCSFVNTTAQSVVQRVTTEGISEGKTKTSFTTRSTCLVIQKDFPVLRSTHVHLHEGTRPSKMLTIVRDVKHHLKHAAIAKDGLKVVKYDVPFHLTQECIIVPRSVQNWVVFNYQCFCSWTKNAGITSRYIVQWSNLSHSDPTIFIFKYLLI